MDFEKKKNVSPLWPFNYDFYKKKSIFQGHRNKNFLLDKHRGFYKNVQEHRDIVNIQGHRKKMFRQKILEFI